MSPSPILEYWQHASTSTETIDVPPDGCQDIIFVTDSQEQTQWHLFELAETSEKAYLQSNTFICGVRLRPATIIDRSKLSAHLSQGLILQDTQLDFLSDFLTVNSALDEALMALGAEDIRIENCAKFLGLSQRSLQRLVTKLTDRSPVFWRQLARARRTAKSLYKTNNLSDIAYQSGYADQAHMTRAMVKWFGYRPAEIATNAQLNTSLQAKAYY